MKGTIYSYFSTKTAASACSSIASSAITYAVCSLLHLCLLQWPVQLILHYSCPLETELLLTSSECQSLIAGRNGSNACTVICTLFCKKLLSGIAGMCANPSLLTETMEEGDPFYEQQGLRGFYSCEEVVNLQPTVGVLTVRDIFVAADACCIIVDTLRAEADNHMNGVAAGVLIVSPYSFAVGVELGSFIVFDSHAHHNRGAL